MGVAKVTCQHIKGTCNNRSIWPKRINHQKLHTVSFPEELEKNLTE
jgi:hypothetical protein